MFSNCQPSHFFTLSFYELIQYWVCVSEVTFMQYDFFLMVGFLFSDWINQFMCVFISYLNEKIYVQGPA